MLEVVAENSEEASSKASSLIEAKRADTKSVNKILDGSKVLGEVTNVINNVKGKGKASPAPPKDKKK
ncbi:16066_t:CDS:2 [Dentiscutata erythropus]|uniref:16066_t:CDS:1 n=1 Tax=Dentiscutata erythropus TaxID=1348616 RepID=A0A9N9D707_9GLOM|nr:16066_t:CDS:2 [Dentiscutata erythropus]